MRRVATDLSMEEVIKVVRRQRVLLDRVVRRVLRARENVLAARRPCARELSAGQTDRVVEDLEIARLLCDVAAAQDVSPEHVIIHLSGPRTVPELCGNKTAQISLI